MSESDPIYIQQISAAAKTKPHPVVLTGTLGMLIDDVDGRHVFVNEQGSATHECGPVENQLYKLRFQIAGEFETIQKMKYIGYAGQFQRYVFTKTP